MSTFLPHRTVALLVSALAWSACPATTPDGPPPPVTYPKPVAPPGSLVVTNPGLSQPSVLPALGDCDGDGVLESHVRGDRHLTRTNVSGAWETIEGSTLAGPPTAWPTESVLTDFDGDGFDDLVTLGTGEGASPLMLFRSRGNCTFEEPVVLGGVALDAQTQGCSLQLRDLDRDGLDDVTILRNGPYAVSPVTLSFARDGRPWESVTLPTGPHLEGHTGSWTPFGLLHDDFDGDGYEDLGVMAETQHSYVYWGLGGGGFKQDAARPNPFLPHNPMSITAIDLDRDGRGDWFFSGSSEHLALVGDADPWDANRAAALGLRLSAMSGWGSARLDLDLDGRAELFVANEVSGQWVGPSLFMQDGGGTWHDVAGTRFAPQAGFKLACADLMGDGRPSCLHVGFIEDGTAAQLSAFRFERTGRFLSLRFSGSLSGASAAGAEVRVLGSDPPIVGRNLGEFPNCAPQVPGVLLGVGDRERVDVEVRWPSGLVTRHPGLASDGRHRLVEPALLTLSRRDVPADGVSTVEVTTHFGALPDRGVELTPLGTCPWSGEWTVHADGRRTRTLVAPTTPGTCSLAVVVDGVPLRSIPRVRFRT